MSSVFIYTRSWVEFKPNIFVWICVYCRIRVISIHSVNYATCLIIVMVLDSRYSHRKGEKLLYLTPLEVSCIGGRNRSTWENHRPATSHWSILSHNVASSTPRLNHTHNDIYTMKGKKGKTRQCKQIQTTKFVLNSIHVRFPSRSCNK